MERLWLIVQQEIEFLKINQAGFWNLELYGDIKNENTRVYSNKYQHLYINTEINLDITTLIYA